MWDTGWAKLAYCALAGMILGITGCAGVSGTVNLAPPNSSVSLTFSADSSSIVSGDSVTLQWSAVNATSVQINGVGAVSAQGSMTVSPSATTTYTAVASNASGSTSKAVTITVLPEPFLIVSNHGPDNYYFGPSSLNESVSVYAINPSDSSLTHVSGLGDQDLFTAGTESSNIPPLVSADGRWVFLLYSDGGVLTTAEFSLDKNGNLSGRRQVSPAGTYMIASNPSSSIAMLWSQAGQLQSMRIESDGQLEALGAVPLSVPCMISKFDVSGGHFLCTEAESSGTITEIFRVDLQSGAMSDLGTLPSQANGTMPLGFDASEKHILTYRISPTQNAYSEQVLVFDFNATQGTVAFNNAALTTPPHSSDANPIVLSGDFLFARNGTGTVTTYRLDPDKGTFSAPLASFPTNTDFTIPFIADGPTNSLISLGMQANKVSSFHLNMNSGAIVKSNGPYQAGSAPEFMAIAHQ